MYSILIFTYFIHILLGFMEATILFQNEYILNVFILWEFYTL